MNELEFDTRKTAQRLEALNAYFQAQVVDGNRFICRHYQQCRNSHPGMFFEGQLHHVGNHYDAFLLGRPFRIMIVGQEYGHGPALVSLEKRHQMILEVRGLQNTFVQRNPHKRGVTSALRLLYNIPLGEQHEAEFLGLETIGFISLMLMPWSIICCVLQSRKRKVVEEKPPV